VEDLPDIYRKAALFVAVAPSRDHRPSLLFIFLLTMMFYPGSFTTTLLLGLVGMFLAVAGWPALLP
jgi:hypothetical protein